MVAAVILTLASGRLDPLAAQECPTGFNAYYTSPTGLHFFGRSTWIWKQQGHAAGIWLHTYEYRGETQDRGHTVRGIHHVPVQDCDAAHLQRLLGIPARILTLHNEQIFITGNGDGGCVELDEDFQTISPPAGSVPSIPSGDGTGSSQDPLAEDEWYEWYEGQRFRCHRELDMGWDRVVCYAEP